MPYSKKQISKSIFSIIVVLAVVFIGFSLNNLVERNDFGYYQIKQSWPKGNMSVRNAPGWYGQYFGTISKYKLSDVVFLSKEVEDGGRGNVTGAVRVQFPDGYADVSCVMQYELSRLPENLYALHELYSSNEATKGMIRQQVVEALKNTGSLMNSEEAYADKRSEFIRLAKAQLEQGLYVPEVKVQESTNKDGTKRTTKKFDFLRDKETTMPVINKAPVFSQYGIKIIQFNIKDMDFDPKLTALIESRKDAQKASQDAITAKAEGDTKIAKERAIQEVDKIKMVTIGKKEKEVAELQASKLYEVAKYAALEAEQDKIKKIKTAQGISEELRIADGLSEREKYQIDANVKRDIGVATALKDWVGPVNVITGGGGEDGGSNIENALMLKMMIDLSTNSATANK